MHIDLLRWTRYATYAYLMAVPGLVESLHLLDMHDTARALQAALCCLALAAWAQRFDPSQYQGGRPLTALLGLGLTLTLASIWQAQWPLFAATEACLWVGLIALAWVFSRSSVDDLSREIPGVMAIALLLMGLQELMDIAFAYLSSHPLDLGAVGRGHPNRRHFNHVQTMALVMAILPIWYGQARWMRWSGWFGLAVGIALVWFTGARSTLLAISVVGVAAMIFVSHQRLIWLRRIMLICMFSVIAYQVFYKFIPDYLGIAVLDAETMGDRNQAGTINTRIMLWRHAWEMAAQRPWTGRGGLHYATQSQLPAAHPHNIVLQWAAEWGWISTLLALSALAWWTRHLWLAMWQQLRRKVVWPYSPVVTAAWLATLAGWCDAQFSGTLTMPVSQVWWCLCLGIAATPDSKPSKTLTSQKNLYKNTMAIFGFITITIALHTSYLLQLHATENIQTKTKPRLWIEGSLPRASAATD